MDWVSFDEIKKTVSLQQAIAHYNVPLRRVGSHILRGKCPLPSHSSKESKESFIASLDKGTGGAWSCHSSSCAAARGGKRGGNILDFVAAMEKCSIRDAAIKLQTWFLVPRAGTLAPATEAAAPEMSAAATAPEPKLTSEQEGGAGEGESNKPLAFALKSVDPSHPYLTERGLTPETIQRFGVGFFSGRGTMAGRVVIPIHNASGELVAYAGRSIDGTEPRYRFPAGFHKSLELYNLHRVQGDLSVVVVEGFFDCMKVSQAGYPCVALMGSTMSKVQEKLLAGLFGEVILMLDGDDAGKAATEEIADRLQRSIFQVKTIGLENSVQPDQLTTDQIRTELDPLMS